VDEPENKKKFLIDSIASSHMVIAQNSMVNVKVPGGKDCDRKQRDSGL
jgi:hypothetical protein